MNSWHQNLVVDISRKLPAVVTWWRQRQLSDHSLQSHAGNVSQRLLVWRHVRTQRVHHRLHLRLLHFTHQRGQAANQTHPQNHFLYQLMLVILSGDTEDQMLSRRVDLSVVTFSFNNLFPPYSSVLSGCCTVTERLMLPESFERVWTCKYLEIENNNNLQFTDCAGTAAKNDFLESVKWVWSRSSVIFCPSVPPFSLSRPLISMKLCSRCHPPPVQQMPSEFSSCPSHLFLIFQLVLTVFIPSPPALGQIHNVVGCLFFFYTCMIHLCYFKFLYLSVLISVFVLLLLTQ